MGALNRLDLPANQTPATERWMRFVRDTPDIEGVDIHPHVPDPEAVQPFLDYILPRMRADQTFLRPRGDGMSAPTEPWLEDFRAAQTP